MDDNYYSIHPPEVVSFTEGVINHPPSPLSSAPNTPTRSTESRRYPNRALHSSNNNTAAAAAAVAAAEIPTTTTTPPTPDNARHFPKQPSRVSRKLLPPSMSRVQFSKLPSAVSNQNSNHFEQSQKKKKKPFMKKRDVPFDENPLSMPKLKFSSTERTLRMLKQTTTTATTTTDSDKLSSSTRSHRSLAAGNSLNVPDDEVTAPMKRSSNMKRSTSEKSIDEAPDDEKGARMRNILAEMDEMEDDILASKSEEDVSRTTSSKMSSKPTVPIVSSSVKKNMQGIPMEITLSDSSGIPPPKTQGDELMRSNRSNRSRTSSSTRDEIMESKPRKDRDELMSHRSDEIMATRKGSSLKANSITRGSSSSLKANSITSGGGGADELMNASKASNSSRSKKQAVVSPPKIVPTKSAVVPPTSAVVSPKSISPKSAVVPPKSISPKSAVVPPKSISPKSAVVSPKSAAAPKTKKNTKPKRMSSMTDRALQWLTTPTVEPSAAAPTVAVPKKTDKKSKMDKNIAKIQNTVSRDLVIPDEIHQDVTFNTMLSDAAYFSNAAASTIAAAGKMAVDTLNPTTVCDTASVASIVADEVQQTKTPEEIAADWKQKRRAMEARHSELVYDSSPYSNVMDHAFAVDDDDDKTEVATNNHQLIDDQPGVLGPPSPLRGDKAPSSSGVTGWWLEKELARREQKKEQLKPVETAEENDASPDGAALESESAIVEGDSSADYALDASPSDELTDEQSEANDDEIVDSAELSVEQKTTPAENSELVEEEKKDDQVDILSTSNIATIPEESSVDDEKRSTRPDSVVDAGDVNSDEQDDDDSVTNEAVAAVIVVAAASATTTGAILASSSTDSEDEVSEEETEDGEETEKIEEMKAIKEEVFGDDQAHDDAEAPVTDTTSVISQSENPALVEASDIASVGTEVQSNKAPILIKSLDDINGICKGDILLSLVQAKGVDPKGSTSGASQVRNAVWRMRLMRRRFSLREAGQLIEEPFEPDSPNKATRTPVSRARASLPVDVDDMRVVGGKNQTRALESNAIEHLHFDEFENAVELYDDIHYAYTETFKQRDWSSGNGIVGDGELDTKQYLGNAQHNMGLCHFLNNDYQRALSCFQKAAENRKSPDGMPNSEELTTLVKIALCHHGLGDFSESHKLLEICMESAKGYCKTITDFIQSAEILNNLGCLSFMGGEHEMSMKMFTESLDVQQAILSHSLYGGSVLAGQSTTLNISVTRANVAFLKMCAKDHLAAILSFEGVLASQQMLLYDAHETLIGTMDHLAAANLLGGNKLKALNMLERILRAQVDAYGVDDPRCVNTRSKIETVTLNVNKVKQPEEISDVSSVVKSNAESKDSSKDSTKADSKESSKADSKDTSKADSKDSSNQSSKADSKDSSKSSLSRASSTSNSSANSSSEAGKVGETQLIKQDKSSNKILRKLSTKLLHKPSATTRQPSNGGANLLSL